MGTTRPVMMLTTIRISASSAYRADMAGTAISPSTDRWNTALASAIASSSEISGMLRRLPARISTRSRKNATAGSSSRSSTANSGYGASTAASRAASHNSASRPSTGPRGVSSPVQARTAVSRKPITTPAAKPNSISCACHSRIGNGSRSGMWPRKAAIHSGIDTQASSAVPR